METQHSGTLWHNQVPILLACLTVLVTGASAACTIDSDVSSSRTIRKSESPCVVTRDVTVEKKVKLTLEPGVEMRFRARVGMDVKGTLMAEGSPSERIVFTKDSPSPPPTWPSGIRLVDGYNVTHGRVQLLYKNKWRGVCVNYRNWTQQTVNTACQQLGFRSGNFSFERTADNETHYMLYEHPDCTGEERDVLACPGSNNISIGSRICVNQLTAGLICVGVTPSVEDSHWRGLTFYNSTHRTVNENFTQRNVSASSLRYVDIFYAGVNASMNHSAALSASPYPPGMDNIRVKYSAFDGLNFTESRGLILLSNSEISHNRGFGVNISHYYDEVRLEGTQIHNNHGTGMRTRFMDVQYFYYRDQDTMCQRPIPQGPDTFPIVMVGEPYLQNYCERIFKTTRGNVITIELLEVRVHPEATGTFEIIDAPNRQPFVMANYNLTDGALQQSVTSTTNEVRIRFLWTKPNKLCPGLESCVKITIYVRSGTEPGRDITISDSKILENSGQGLSLENTRSQIVIERTEVAHNTYDSGLRVFEGASDVIVKSSSLHHHNIRSAMNVTYSGGMILLNQTEVFNNTGRGLTTHYIKQNKTRIEKNHTAQITQSKFEFNEGIGAFFGNYCSPGHILVNYTTFRNNLGDAVEFESCYLHNKNVSNFTMTFNRFENNHRMTVRMNPALNVVGRLSNNTFTKNKYGGIYIDNTDKYVLEKEWRSLPVDYQIFGNNMTDNSGWFVANVRLVQDSGDQKLLFMYNRIVNNKIQQPFPRLNPRSRAAAVVIVSSTNVLFQRNFIHNPDSMYEVATHLIQPAQVIDIRRNYWKYFSSPTIPDIRTIAAKMFDRDQRYDLAMFVYAPTLITPQLYSNRNDDPQLNYEEKFIRGETIGGELTTITTPDGSMDLRLPKGDYYVDRDISVGIGSSLTIAAGTKLRFASGIGILVKHEMIASGSLVDPIVFGMEEHNYTVSENDTTPVRLVGGVDMFEGRVEVMVDGEWSTICNKGFDMTDAAVVCQELGMSLHPDDWYPDRNIPGSPSQKIVMSQVECDKYDSSILSCPHSGLHDHSCTHGSDVAIRCKPMTWAGIRYTVTSSRSTLTHAQLSMAGLLDFEQLRYAPAVQIDFNKHLIHHLQIEECLSPGLLVSHNHPFVPGLLHNIVSRNNLGSGILSRCAFMNIHSCQLTGNKVAGFQFDPKFSQLDASIARNLMTGTENIMDYAQSGILIRGDTPSYLITYPSATDENRTVDIQISTELGFKVSLYLLDYNPDKTEEEVILFAGRKGSIPAVARNWTIEEDNVDLPIDGSQFLVVRFVIRKRLSGRFAAIAFARQQDLTNPVPKLQVHKSTFRKNRYGVNTVHYSNPSNEFFDLFFRNRFSTLHFFENDFIENSEYAMYIPSQTKYHESYMPTYAELEGSARVSEITYRVNDCNFTQNQGGIRGDHNHVEFSNNVWHWEVERIKFERNNGGFEIELPMVGRGYSWKDKDSTWYINKSPVDNKPIDPWQDPRLLHLFWVHNHTFHMNQSTFQHNTDFKFRLGGYYANSSLKTNVFNNNHCQKGLMTIAGMEKEMVIQENKFTENTCKYVLDYDVKSHYEYVVKVKGEIWKNNMKNNRPPLNLILDVGQPQTYALAVKGVQSLIVNRNLFKNTELQYEVVAGLTVAWLKNVDHVLDVRENYWGTTSQIQVRERIFDFDDWNSYVLASYYPYLIQDRYDSIIASEDLYTASFNPDQPLGGRLSVNVLLRKRSKPYVIKSDLTIMPGFSLIIDAGAEFRIHPNVGILILGSMRAIGTANNRIRFLPFYDMGRSKRSEVAPVKREKRAIMTSHIYRNADKRLFGGKQQNEGFVQFFNVTAHRWELMCDYQFSWQVGRAVCQDLGYDYDNVVIRFTSYFDYLIYGYEKESIKFFWRTSYYCEGDEGSLDDCVHRINYQLESCMAKKDYVYLRCEKSKLLPGQKYWGNIRFASTEPEYKSDLPASEMKYVDIFGAGILHGEFVAAIQSTYLAPILSYMNIQNCAHNGIDYVAPWFSFVVANSTFTQNVGHGIGVVVLNGETSDEGGTLVPLQDNTIPHRTFGMVSMCDAAKEITVTSRILVYYKYSFAQSSCVKVFRSRYDKRVALRFLQLDLYHDNFSRNAIEVFDGDQFANASTKIGEILANSTEEARLKTYVTTKLTYSLSLHIHASAAKDSYGFIAEVVTLPLNLFGMPPREPRQYNIIGDIRHTDNQAGFVKYRGVGKNNPDIEIMRCLVRDNGIRVLNLTSPAMIDMFIQNNARLNIINNYISNNRGGGIVLYTYANEYERAMYANITTNLIDGNSHGPPVHLAGSRFQQIKFAHNYVGHNNVEHRNIIAVFGVGMNMMNNTVFENTGSSVLNVSSDKDVGIYQFYSHNYLYRNKAIGPFHTTVFLNSSRQKFEKNYFFNEMNDLEMATTNRTRLPRRNNEVVEIQYDRWGRPLPTPEPPLDESRVEAENNWWGSHLVYYVSGRIRDIRHDRYLVGVNWEPYYKDNSSVLEGYCPPGWTRHGPRCYIYMGGALPSTDARAQCMHEEGKLADSTNIFSFLPNFIRAIQPDYNHLITRVWVDYTGIGSPSSSCTVIRNVWLETYDCDSLFPFVCEKEPIPFTPIPWMPIIIGLTFLGFAILLICCLLLCYKLKSGRREKERLSRRDSVRASVRGSRMGSRMGSRASLGTMSVGSARNIRTNPRSNVYSIGGATVDYTSTDDIDKKGLPRSLQSTPAHSLNDLTDSRANGSIAGSTFTNRDSYKPRLENEIGRIKSKAFDTVFENPGYDETLEDRRRPSRPFQDFESETTSQFSDLKKQPSMSSLQSYDSSPSTIKKSPFDPPSSRPSISGVSSRPDDDYYRRDPRRDPKPPPSTDSDADSIRKPPYNPPPSRPSEASRPDDNYYRRRTDPRRDRPSSIDSDADSIRKPPYDPPPQTRPKPQPPSSRPDDSYYRRRPDRRPPSTTGSESDFLVRPPGRPEPAGPAPPRYEPRDEPPRDLPSLDQSPGMRRRPMFTRQESESSLASLEHSPGARRRPRPEPSLGASRESLPPRETDF